MKNSQLPKISIIVPVYNTEKKYLIECLESVVYQDYQGSINLIVIDNESTIRPYKDFIKLVKFFEAPLCSDKFDRKLIIEQAENIYKYSWYEPTRKGLEYIEDSEYFMFLASDDVLEPNFISNCIKIISKAPDKIKALQSPVKFFGKWNHIQNYRYKNLEEFKEQMLQRSVVNTPTIIWHNSFYDDGLMDLAEPDKYFGADDYALYCEFATRGHFIYPSPIWLGYNYRIHEKNASWGMHGELDSVNTIDKEIQQRYKLVWNIE